MLAAIMRILPAALALAVQGGHPAPAQVPHSSVPISGEFETVRYDWYPRQLRYDWEFGQGLLLRRDAGRGGMTLYWAPVTLEGTVWICGAYRLKFDRTGRTARRLLRGAVIRRGGPDGPVILQNLSFFDGLRRDQRMDRAKARCAYTGLGPGDQPFHIALDPGAVQELNVRRYRRRAY